MTKEKELLLKDLCARLPYGVIVKVTKIPIQVSKDEVLTYNRMYSLSEPEEYLTVKPYLRPMSSMTEEELIEYRKMRDKIAVQWDDNNQPVGYTYAQTISSIDWLLKKKFDFRGLIPKGLALEAPKDMYKED